MQWLAAQGTGFLASIWGGLLTIAVLLWLFRRSAAVDHLLSTVPVIGRLRSYLELTEFSYLLGMLLEQSMPLTTALETTATGLNHTPIATACRDIAANVRQGKTLASSLALSRFPPALQAMVGWGEQQGALPYALEAAGDFYAGRAELEEGLLRHAITPLTLLLLLAGVLFLVRGLLGPMVKLITTLTG
jgi:type II secretory pathway component PulF